MSEKRRGSEGLDDGRDSKRLRSADGSPPNSAPAPGSKAQVGEMTRRSETRLSSQTDQSVPPNSNQIDAMIAQKKAEIAAKLAAMKPGGGGPANPTSPGARPPAPTGPPARSGQPIAVNQTDLARRITEAKERIRQQMSAANVPTIQQPTAVESTKRGLAIETHPVLEMLAQKSEEGAKGAKAIVPKPVFATTKVGWIYSSCFEGT